MLSGLLYPTKFLQYGEEGLAKLWEPRLRDAAVQSSTIRQRLTAIFEAFPRQQSPNEATTEQDLILKVLDVLGWDYLPKQHATAADIPDFLLFQNNEAKQRANSEARSENRFKHGIAVLEAKAWNVVLDRRGQQATDRVPSSQIIRYLTQADVQSNGAIQWGILTNGKLWRLYYNKARSRAEEYLEVDLEAVLEPTSTQGTIDFIGIGPDRALNLFITLFGPAAFKPVAGAPTLHEYLLQDSRRWEAQVADDLRKVVFGEVFPELLTGLWQGDPNKPEVPNEAYLHDLRENALLLLYRLLFVFYAEDRDLLPRNDEAYDDYSVFRIRQDVARRIDQQDRLSSTLEDYGHKLKNLFKAIDRGEDSIGLPAYNGGLFKQERTPILNQANMPDAVLAPTLDRLSRRDEGGQLRLINYRDLSVQQLGTIYEGLLEFNAVVENDRILLKPNAFARKTSGSYYTPDSLVQLVINKSVGTLVQEKIDAFNAQVEQLKGEQGSAADKNTLLAHIDPATAILELKICDPAMGSGHFLVSLVDYLADKVLEATTRWDNLPWEAEQVGESPLLERIEYIRSRILAQAAKHGWRVNERHLDDKNIVRRMILKRCVYGVDKNPMAVELAKVSLWLHTFTVGAPLSFLDHHLRCGDSLFGEWVYEAMSKHLFLGDAVAKAMPSAQAMERIEQLTDIEVAEVNDSQTYFLEVQRTTAPLNAVLSMYHALQWLTAGEKAKSPRRKAADGIMEQGLGNPLEIALGAALTHPRRDETPGMRELLSEAMLLAKQENFLHWQVAFPRVWNNWDREHSPGGFDAVIGNPPWDRLKLQEVEWFAERDPAIAQQQRAADRKRLIQQQVNNQTPLGVAYTQAATRAEAASLMARKAGQYPLLSGGDINLYSLFVERAHRLVQPKGIVALVVPSGICTSETSSEFFSSITEGSRLGYLYDFENRGLIEEGKRKRYFIDVDSRENFCVYVAGGQSRTYKASRMGFFLPSISDSDEYSFEVDSSIFRLLNPNTGTATVLSHRKDFELAKSIYQQFPVLNDHSTGKTWPFLYKTMFHMTNDSGLFRTREELESERFYPGEIGTMKKGQTVYLPLYEGKMMHQFTHRHASIKVNNENLHNQATGVETEVSELRNPDFYVTPQYFVPISEVENTLSRPYVLAFRDIARPTDERTVISAVLPKAGVGNTSPILLMQSGDNARQCAWILANINSFCFDYFARQKVQTRHLNLYILEQLPVVPPDVYQDPLGTTTIGDYVCKQVLELSYTAHDLAAFAADLGYNGPPFPWDENDRAHRRARLDALYFHLYGIDDESDIVYILGTFPIVKRKDWEVHGNYRTLDLILKYHRALLAGDLDSVAQGPPSHSAQII